MENENKEFFENLNKLTKQEIVNYIYNYWDGLKTDAHNRMENKDELTVLMSVNENG